MGMTAKQETQRTALLALAGAVALVVGSFLPWIVVRAPFVGQFSKSGMDAGGDGLITLLGGLLVGGLGVVILQSDAVSRSQGVILLVVALLALGVVVIDYMDVQNRVEDIGAGFGEVGSGLYVCGLGGLLTGVAALVALLRQ